LNSAQFISIKYNILPLHSATTVQIRYWSWYHLLMVPQRISH